MRLTSFTDHGLRMLMASAPERPLSTADLATEFDLSRNHLSRIMQCPARDGIVETRRDGGAGLARPAAELRLGEPVAIMGADQPIVECFDAGASRCTIDGRRRLKARLRVAERGFLSDLDRSSPADIALPARSTMA